MTECKNDYKKGDIPFQDYRKSFEPKYARMSFGKILTIGTAACALISAHDFHNTVLDEATIVRKVDALERYEAEIEKNVKVFNKLMAVIVNTNDAFRQSLMNQLMSFRSLVHNWDGYGAIPTGARCAATAVKVINGLSNQAVEEVEDFFPNTNGSVSFKWTNVLGERLSLSVGAESFSYYCKRNGVDVEMLDDVQINELTLNKLNEDIQSVMIANV